MILDLNKNDYIEFEKVEVEDCEYLNLNQDISRSWRFLQNTHKLKENEIVCIRGLVHREKYDKFAYNKELIINSFDDKNFLEYKKFIEKLITGKRIYNLFYNIYKTDKNKAREYYLENSISKFSGVKANCSGTDILIVDFDNCKKDDYLNIKSFFQERGLQTTDVMSGHGYHFIIHLKETCQDELVLSKFLFVLKELGFTPDISCKDAGRVMRMPFFYNRKINKYGNKTIKATLIDGEYSYIEYDLEDVFQKLGYDYNNINLEEEYEKKQKRIYEKHNKEDVNYTYNENVDLYKLYPMLNIDILPTGIRNMLKGFREGYSNTITMILTLYFKRNGIKLDDIIEILNVTESINSNNWNYWNVEDEVARFYENYDFINKYELIDMEEVFGPIDFYKNVQKYKVPIKMLKANELKLYLYFLINEDKKKKEILEDVGYSNNKFDRNIKKFDKIGKNYILNVEIDRFVLLTKRQIEKLLTLNANEISVCIYLYFRLGIKNEISTSIQSIKNYTLLSEHTISDTIKTLENKDLLKVKRNPYIKEYNKKESNKYQLRVF